MFVPTVKFDEAAFHRDMQPRILRSRKAHAETLNDLAAQCTRAAWKACPVGDRGKIQAMLTINGVREIKNKKGGSFKKPRSIKNYGGQARNIIVGSYVKLHGAYSIVSRKYVKGSGTISGLDLSFGGSVSQAAKTLVNRRISHLTFLASRFIKPYNDLCRAIRAKGSILFSKTEQKTKFKDNFGYAVPAVFNFSNTSQAQVFTPFTYTTEKGSKTQTVTPKGQAILRKAMDDGRMAAQNDWRKTTEERLAKSLGKPH